MSRILVSVFALILLTDAALADGSPAVAKGPPPRFVVVVSLKEQELTVREVVYQPKAYLLWMEENGRWIPQAVAEQVTTPEQYRVNTLQCSLASCRLFDCKGKKLGLAHATKWLQPGRTLLLSADGKAVDPFYLHVFKQNTVVLVCPKDVPAAQPEKKAQPPAKDKPKPRP